MLILNVSFVVAQNEVPNTTKEAEIKGQELKDVVIVGSRNTKRTVVNSAVPIDIIDVKASGLDLLRRLMTIDPTTRVLMLTGYGSIATAMEAVRLGAVNYLTKPADVDDILAAFNPEAPAGEANLDQATPSLARVEWEHIQRVLNDCEGNLSEAARRLGMHRRSLQRKASRKRPAK